MKFIFLFIFISFIATTSFAQTNVQRANNFISLLNSAQKEKALFPFDTEERFNFHFFPKDDRKGLIIRDMDPSQRSAAMLLFKSCISDNAVKKIGDIMELEKVLMVVEKRKPDDHFRDPEKYYVSIFGIPAEGNIWGWRLEGHHITFNFSSKGNQLISGTPGFLGTNPGIVQDGPQKGKQVLKEESDRGFALLHSFTKVQMEKVLIDTTAPNEIITFVSRKALGIKPAGIWYGQMNKHQQEGFLQLLRLYIDRYTKLLADKMLKEIQAAGLENLSFAWAGAKEPMIGKPHYYRIEGPTIIIEYDNSQNNANHVHSVIRDLKNDFGGDELLEHYKTSH